MPPTKVDHTFREERGWDFDLSTICYKLRLVGEQSGGVEPSSGRYCYPVQDTGSLLFREYMGTGYRPSITTSLQKPVTR